MHQEMYFHTLMRKTNISYPKILLTNDTTSNILTYRFAYSLLSLFQFYFGVVMQFIIYIKTTTSGGVIYLFNGMVVIYANKIKI